MKIHTINSTSILSRRIRLIGAILTITLMMPTIAFSQATVNLQTAANFGILAGAAITGSSSFVSGDVGTTAGSIAGVTVAPGDTIYPVNDPIVVTAQSNLATAYSDAASRIATSLSSGAYDLSATGTFVPGVYSIGGNATMSTGVTLNGSGVYIFQITGNLTTAASISLAGGAVWTDVFWQVGGFAALGAGFTFEGTIMAYNYITVGAGSAIVHGRLLAETSYVTEYADTVLPVELTTFTAALNNNAVELNWNTATEVNNYGFDIERSQMSEVSSQNLTWNKIGFVKGYGNSNSPKNYSFVDNTVSSGSYAYRLKQIDNDGTYKYSSVVEVNAGQMQYSFLLNQNYPNPFNPSTEIQFGVSKNSPATLTIFNVLGEKVATLFNGNAIAGQVYNVTLNGSNLASGIYYYKLQTNDKTEVKKMLLMK